MKLIHSKITNIGLALCILLAGIIFSFIPTFHHTYILAILVSSIILLFTCFPDRTKKNFDFIVRYRYAFGIALILLLTVFKVTGSSIVKFDDYFQDTEGPGSPIIYGMARDIRSDDWALQTPYYMSQSTNKYNLFNPFIHIGNGQNMIVGFNAPVLDITALGKPATWGYFLFGPEYGMAFYWNFKLIFLFLLSFEVCLLITKRSRGISLLGAFWITFSPAVQWWFSPHFVDVIFWAFALLVVIWQFFMAKNNRYRLLFTLLIVSSTVGFALAIYPGLQIPLGLMALGLAAAFIRRDRLLITFRKIHFIFVACGLFCIAAILGYFFITSGDALYLIMNTAYPGARISTGGGLPIKALFPSLPTPFLPFNSIPYANNSEISSFIHFTPALLLLTPFFWHKRVKNYKTGLVLTAMLAVCILWMFVSFPEIIARLTLFSYVSRINYVYGLIALLYTIWAIDTTIKNQELIGIKKFWIPVLFFFVYRSFIDAQELSYLSLRYYLIEILGLSVLLFLILCGAKRVFATGMGILIFITGCTINPVILGNDSMTNKTVIKEARRIANSNPDARFMFDGTDFPLPNLLVANGVKTVFASNFYPDLPMWKKLDPSSKYIGIFNRYANMSSTISESDTTEISLIAADHIYVQLSYADLEKLNIKYILSIRELKKVGDVRFEKIFDAPRDPDIYAVHHDS